MARHLALACMILGNAAAAAAACFQASIPALWPKPQTISTSNCGVALNVPVNIVTGTNSDAAAINVIKNVIAAAGGTAAVSSTPINQGTQILIGTAAENPSADAAAKFLAGNSAGNLTAEGYVLASGLYGSSNQPTVVLNGVDGSGTFYAAQTLRQLVSGAGIGVPGVKIQDWPLMPIRGSVEGFYGIPWTQNARLDHFVFFGKHKLNTYIYTPKNDKYLRDNWRQPYDSDSLNAIKQLVDAANANHVIFTFALSPGQDLCYSSDSDFNTTVTKFEQIRKLGVKAFYVPFDDIDVVFNCDADKTKWPQNKDQKWLADAQAYYLNRVQTEYIQKNGLNNLQTVPTDYYGSDASPYKAELGSQLNKNIRMQWTGERIVTDDFPASSAIKADKTYSRDKLFVWDNFPDNDGEPGRLYLKPLTGRAPDLYKYHLGFTSNPMLSAYASMPALANFGDYTWNGPSYDAAASTKAVLSELAGNNAAILTALVAFVDLHQFWTYSDNPTYAPQLKADINAYWAARADDDPSNDDDTAFSRRLTLLKTIPEVLSRMPIAAFAKDVEPWTTVAVQWANACQHLIATLNAIDTEDKAKSDSEYKLAKQWIAKTKAKTISTLGDDGQVVKNSTAAIIGDGLFDTFYRNVTDRYNAQ